MVCVCMCVCVCLCMWVCVYVCVTQIGQVTYATLMLSLKFTRDVKVILLGRGGGHVCQRQDVHIGSEV
jgi:hypothetical protein